MLRVVLAGILGGIAMFMWSGIAHMVLPLGRIGIKELPNDAPVVAALQASAGENRGGLYLFPSQRGPDGMLTEGGYAKKLETTAHGLVAYQPPGTPMLTPRQLVGEYALETVEALILAFLLRFTSMHTMAGRLAYTTVIGLAAVIATNGSYWNWYGFPLDYTLAYAFTQWVGFMVAGAVIAVVYGWARRRPAAA
jgi:hypothetical protein